MKHRHFYSLLVIVLLFISCRSQASNIGKPLPLLQTTTINNQTLDFESPTGCKTEKCVAVVMAPWCGYCKKMIAPLNKFARKNPVKAIIGLSSDHIAIVDFANKFSFPVFSDEDRELTSLLSIKGVPYFVVYDQKGMIIKEHYGYIPDANEMKNILLD